MKTLRYRSGMPYVLAALVVLLYAAVFGMSSTFGYVAGLLLAYLVYAPMTRLFPDRYVVVEDLPKSKDPQVNKVIDQCAAELREIRVTGNGIYDPWLLEKVDLITIGYRTLLRHLSEDSALLGPLRSYLRYLLPTTSMLLKIRVKLQDPQKNDSPTAVYTRRRIDEALLAIEQSLEAQMGVLDEHLALDVDTDVQMIKEMLGQSGVLGAKPTDLIQALAQEQGEAQAQDAPELLSETPEAAFDQDEGKPVRDALLRVLRTRMEALAAAPAQQPESAYVAARMTPSAENISFVVSLPESESQSIHPLEEGSFRDRTTEEPLVLVGLPTERQEGETESAEATVTDSPENTEVETMAALPVEPEAPVMITEENPEETPPLAIEVAAQEQDPQKQEETEVETMTPEQEKRMEASPQEPQQEQRDEVKAVEKPQEDAFTPVYYDVAPGSAGSDVGLWFSADGGDLDDEEYELHSGSWVPVVQTGGPTAGSHQEAAQEPAETIEQAADKAALSMEPTEETEVQEASVLEAIQEESAVSAGQEPAPGEPVESTPEAESVEMSSVPAEENVEIIEAAPPEAQVLVEEKQATAEIPAVEPLQAGEPVDTIEIAQGGEAEPPVAVPEEAVSAENSDASPEMEAAAQPEVAMEATQEGEEASPEVSAPQMRAESGGETEVVAAVPAEDRLPVLAEPETEDPSAAEHVDEAEASPEPVAAPVAQAEPSTQSPEVWAALFADTAARMGGQLGQDGMSAQAWLEAVQAEFLERARQGDAENVEKPQMDQEMTTFETLDPHKLPAKGGNGGEALETWLGELVDGDAHQASSVGPRIDRSVWKALLGQEDSSSWVQ